MRSEEFRRRALEEGRRYAEDPMVFLRELAQNARDAGATRIGVSTGVRGGRWAVTFGDDGSGMDLEHARRYLFTLYASSKEGDPASAGRFGVGFWSVLLFHPSVIEVESRTRNGEAWKVVLDGDLATPAFAAGGLQGHGTRVAIWKAIGSDAEGADLDERVKRALLRYGGFLRQADRTAAPLPIFLNGEALSRPLSVDGPFSMTFREPHLEGAVGLGERPRVELYARGLPAWHGTILDELRYGAVRARQEKHPAGLAPVYRLSGHRLNVTLDRRAVIDDRELCRVRRSARRRMREALSLYLDRVSPPSLGERVLRLFSDRVEDLRSGEGSSLRAALLAFVAVLLAAAFAGGLWAVFGQSGPAPVPAREVQAGVASGGETEAVRPRDPVPLGSRAPYLGPAVDRLAPEARLAIAYRPPQPLLLRTAAYERLDAGRGIAGSPPVPAGPARPLRCRQRCFDLQIQVRAEPGPLVLPVPTGYGVDPESLSLDGKRFGPLQETAAGEPIVALSSPLLGTIAYRAGPRDDAPAEESREVLLSIPGTMRLPPSLETEAVEAARQATAATRVDRLERLVAERIRYDRSDRAADAYARFFLQNPRSGWIDLALSEKRGDCDVQNAVLVALLRRAGVRSRLAIGVGGEAGRAQPGMHAWVEYLDRGWRIADASRIESPSEAPARQVSAPGPATAEPRPAPADRNGARLLAGLAALAALIALAARLSRRNRGALFASGDEATADRTVAEMLENALTDPEAWAHARGAARRRLIPTLGGRRRMSLEEALRRGRARSLWCSRGESSLARWAVERRRPVLDASHAAFGPLIRRLPGVIDLDEVAGLRPIPLEKLPRDLAHVRSLLEQVDRLLVEAGLPGRLILATLGLRNSPVRDVDLVRLGLPRRAGWRSAFVAVEARSEAILERGDLALRAPDLAAFLTLELLVERSRLLRPFGEAIRAAAARRCIGGER